MIVCFESLKEKRESGVWRREKGVERKELIGVTDFETYFDISYRVLTHCVYHKKWHIQTDFLSTVIIT